MSRYDGLIIPRSYSEYINKTDAATLQQALQLSGVLSGAVAAGDNKAVKSDAVNNALTDFLKAEKTIIPISTVTNYKISTIDSIYMIITSNSNGTELDFLTRHSNSFIFSHVTSITNLVSFNDDTLSFVPWCYGKVLRVI